MTTSSNTLASPKDLRTVVEDYRLFHTEDMAPYQTTERVEALAQHLDTLQGNEKIGRAFQIWDDESMYPAPELIEAVFAVVRPFLTPTPQPTGGMIYD